MALMVLTLVGMLLGWLASIVMRTEAARQIGAQIALALAASLGAGLYVNQFTVMGGLSPAALGAGAGAAFLVLIAYHLLNRRKTDAR